MSTNNPKDLTTTTSTQKPRSIPHLHLEDIVMDKYILIWSHPRTQMLIQRYNDALSIAEQLTQKGVPCKKDLRECVKLSPLCDKHLEMSLDQFQSTIANTNLRQLRNISEKFDIILTRMNDGDTSRNLNSFIAERNYQLAHFGEPKPRIGYDPDFRSTTGHRHSTHGFTTDSD